MFADLFSLIRLIQVGTNVTQICDHKFIFHNFNAKTIAFLPNLTEKLNRKTSDYSVTNVSLNVIYCIYCSIFMITSVYVPCLIKNTVVVLVYFARGDGS